MPPASRRRREALKCATASRRTQRYTLRGDRSAVEAAGGPVTGKDEQGERTCVMGIFGTQKASKGTVEQVADMIESYYHKRELNPQQQELPGAEGYGWWLSEGSAKVYIFVQDTASGPVLRITSPLVHVPEDNREAFYRKLLDVNANLSSCALATHDNIVLVVAQRPTMALDQEELDSLVWNVAFVADLLDDQLASEFNTRHFVS